MRQQQQQGAQHYAPPGMVELDTGLTPHQQRQREAAVQMWAWRITDLMSLTGCSVADALRAVELADSEASKR